MIKHDLKPIQRIQFRSVIPMACSVLIALLARRTRAGAALAGARQQAPEPGGCRPLDREGASWARANSYPLVIEWDFIGF